MLQYIDSRKVHSFIFPTDIPWLYFINVTKSEMIEFVVKE